jgi:hypothetical protein
MSGLNCAILMRALLRLGLHVEILTIGNIRFFLRNLESPWMTALLGLSPLLVDYVLVVLLHILIMNMLNSCYMHLMIMFGYENYCSRRIC